MLKHIVPAVDGAISPQAGRSRLGQPLSYNRAPAADLAPWIARLYGTVVEAPADHRLVCGLFNDTSVIRIQLAGVWEAETADGYRRHEKSALTFGPQTRRMPVTVTGSFVSVGVALRPGSGRVLFGTDVSQLVDRLRPISGQWMCEAGLIASLEAIDGYDDPERWLVALENQFRGLLRRTGRIEPDPITARFEMICFSDPTLPIAEIAGRLDISPRQLERLIRRDYGMPPKQVLRRARALDMASHLRGVADAAEAEELALRYYDQSHLTREFTDLFGMSPRQFVSRPQPLLTLALESRQARRLEAIDRITPGQLRPWQ